MSCYHAGLPTVLAMFQLSGIYCNTYIDRVKVRDPNGQIQMFPLWGGSATMPPYEQQKGVQDCGRRLKERSSSPDKHLLTKLPHARGEDGPSEL